MIVIGIGHVTHAITEIWEFVGRMLRSPSHQTIVTPAPGPLVPAGEPLGREIEVASKLIREQRAYEVARRKLEQLDREGNPEEIRTVARGLAIATYYGEEEDRKGLAARGRGPGLPDRRRRALIFGGIMLAAVLAMFFAVPGGLSEYKVPILFVLLCCLLAFFFTGPMGLHFSWGKATVEPDPLKKYETVVSSGQSALRALLTLNGGATIAFLAFIGHVMETGTMPLESGRVFVSAMQWFIYGAFFAVLAYGTIFLTNCLSMIERRRPSDWMFAVTLLCGFASLGCFLAGSWQAIRGFELANKHLAGG